MQLVKITNHIYYSEPEEKSDRPVLGYIVGSKLAIMVDAGNSKEHYESYLELLKENGLNEPSKCVITHWHWDHTFALHALKQESYAHINTNKKLKEISLWKWNDTAMKERLAQGIDIEFADTCMREEYKNVEDIQVIPATYDIQDSLTFDCGEITCQCIHLPSAHSDDSIVVYVPEEKIVFIGDIYGDDLYNHEYRDLEKTKMLYEALDTLDFEFAIPGHSKPLPKENY